jgi:hypothetical protein
MNATQERIEANTKSMRKDIKSGQEKIRSIVYAWMTDMNDDRKKRQRPPKKRRRQIQRRLSQIKDDAVRNGESSGP